MRGGSRRNDRELKETEKIMKRISLFTLATLLLLALATAVGYTRTSADDDRGDTNHPPWIGLQMQFEQNTNGTPEHRTVTFLAEDSDGNTIIRDSTPTADGILYVDPQSREVRRCESPSNNFFLCGLELGQLVEYWVPPRKLKIGSEISILGFNATVIDKRTVSVMGKQVTGFIVQGRFLEDGTVIQDTWVFEKNTGLLLAASFVNMDSDTGDVFFSVGLQLTHTNQGFSGGEDD